MAGEPDVTVIVWLLARLQEATDLITTMHDLEDLHDAIEDLRESVEIRMAELDDPTPRGAVAT